MAGDDYAAFKDAPDPKDLTQLTELVTKLVEAEVAVEKAEAALKERKAALAQVSERDIPFLMAKCGLSEFRTKAGLRVRVKDDVHASITKANNAEAIAWLDSHGHSGLVKRSVYVDFGKQDEKKAKALLDSLRKKFENVGEEATVHNSTLRAFIRGQLAEGKEIPMALFGVEPFKETIVESKAT